MARLAEPQKRFLVHRIARFVPLTEIRAEFFERFGEAISLSQASAYNPETARGQADMSTGLKTLFEEERARFIAEEEKIPIANRAYRLRRLQNALERCDAYRESLPQKAVGLHIDVAKLEATLLRAAAEDRGGAFERQRQRGEDSGQRGALDQLRDFLAEGAASN